MPPLPAFSLSDLHGTVRRFPTARLHLLCFLKADCPTCVLLAPGHRPASDSGCHDDEMRAEADAIGDQVVAALRA